jgi:hypothetical protein
MVKEMTIICNISVILLRKEDREIKMLDRFSQLGGKLLQ